jgi:hypothetical protein
VEEQIQRFGVAFGRHKLRQGHSRLTAYAASRTGDIKLAKRAWSQFYFEEGYDEEDGYDPDTPWSSKRVGAEDALSPVDEAP